MVVLLFSAIDFLGHIDGSALAPQGVKALSKWEIKDAWVMTWILSSVEPHLVLNLKPYKTTTAIWNYLNTVYNQDNSARRFQLEYEMANFTQGTLSAVQAVHTTSEHDQFLMKLRRDFEIARSNLMNRHPVPSLDACLSELLCEEQHIVTQSAMEHQANVSAPVSVAYAAQGRNKGRDMKQGTTYHASTGASSSIALPVASPIVPIPPSTALANPNTLTPEMVQQMIIYAFSAFELSGNHRVSSKPWCFDSRASNHMTNIVVPLSNVRNYDRNLKINTADGSSLPISAVGDLSSSLTDDQVSRKMIAKAPKVG
ncbi:hypothetical protein Pint_23410 [Pistacia integerrima]|uniref:Uncharacterized protein n=1 Tax=Pistacia integerrima TaxID=434235 RepID=A0ACC0YM50_9ROSI|nr:hypothetical protein Pint_23410 [Pistacia integerrima]